MEVIIVIIILSIIGFFVYQSLPNTKFEKAQTYFNAKNYNDAISLFNEIFEKHIDAPTKFAECKLILGKGLKNNSEKIKAFNEILELKNRIINKSSFPKFEKIEAQVIFEIAKIRYEEAKDNIDKINENIRFIDNAKKNGIESDFKILRTQHIEEPVKIAERKLLLIPNINSSNEKLKALNDILSLKDKIIFSDSLIKFEHTEAKILFEIAKIQYEQIKGDIEKLNQNIKFIDNSNKKGLENDFNALKTKHFYQLTENYFKKAIETENINKYSEAILLFKMAIDLSEKSNNPKIKNNSIVRILICRLKHNENISLTYNKEIKNSNIEYQNDLFYRYSIYLLKRGEYQQAEYIILNHLNQNSYTIDKLREILKAEKINSSINQITLINKKIELLYDNSLSTEEIKKIYDGLDSIVANLKTINNELSEKILAIKPTLFNRLLTNYISIEQYEKAINLIQKYPKFWESPELLKNLGICCFGFTFNGLLTESNYKIIISSWLTSVYSDNVILKSLEDTTWDDSYTFSLIESIGSNYSQHTDVPENVNYDSISECNISIGATQREILQQFETILHTEIKDQELSMKVNDFYDKEKEALEKIINILSSDILFPTPHFAITNDLNNDIITELDSDYEEFANDETLEAGVPYINKSTSSIVYQYFYANDIIDRIKAAIKAENSATIKKLNTNENKGWIEKFTSISSSFEDSLFNAIAIKISKNDENEALIPVMEECIAISSNNEKLKHQYSNYVASYCISQVNNDKIDNFKALTMMKESYINSPNNTRICKNFITLIRCNLMDILNERTKKASDIYIILDWVKKNMSRTFKQNNSELGHASSEIIEQLKKSGVDTSLLISSPLGQINLNSFGKSLTPEGLKMKKVLSYLDDLGGKNELLNFDDLDSIDLTNISLDWLHQILQKKNSEGNS